MPKPIRNLFWIKKSLVSHFINFSNLKLLPKETKDVNKTDTAIIVENKSNDKEESKTETQASNLKDALKYSFPKQSDSKFNKTLVDEYWILAIHEEAIMTIYDPSSTPVLLQAENLINQDSFGFAEYKNGLIMANGSKKGECRFLYSTEASIEEITTFTNNIYHISCIAFNKSKEGNLLCATSSHDRKIIIYEFIQGENSKNGFFILPRITLK